MKKIFTIGVVILFAIGISSCLSSDDTTEIITPTPSSPIDYMKDIPEKPDDFDIMVRELKSGYIDLLNVPPEYYLQPEFYPFSWGHGLDKYEEHNYDRWGVYGHGGYPANAHITFNNPTTDDWISYSTFYRTGWGIETWQGLKMVSDDSEYFDVTITPNEFLLTPTFPKFTSGWVQKLKIRVDVKEKPPVGTYNINVHVVNPSEENATEWFMTAFKQEMTPEALQMVEECSKTKPESECMELITVGRRNKYVNAGFIQIGNRLTIEIDVK